MYLHPHLIDMNPLLLLRESQSLAAILNGSLFLIYITIFLRKLHTDMRRRILFIDFTEQGCIPFKLLSSFGRGTGLDITIMVNITLEHLPRIFKRIQPFMDRRDEPDVWGQMAHTPYLGVIIGSSLPIVIIPLYISSRLIFPVFSAFEESDDLRRILEPFVVVQIEEPFSVRLRKSRVSCFRKIITPGKRNNMGSILPGDLKRLLIFSGENDDQFAVYRIQKRNNRIQTSLQGVSPIRYQKGDCKL